MSNKLCRLMCLNCLTTVNSCVNVFNKIMCNCKKSSSGTSNLFGKFIKICILSCHLWMHIFSRYKSHVMSCLLVLLPWQKKSKRETVQNKTLIKTFICSLYIDEVLFRQQGSKCLQGSKCMFSEFLKNFESSFAL